MQNLNGIVTQTTWVKLARVLHVMLCLPGVPLDCSFWGVSKPHYLRVGDLGHASSMRKVFRRSLLG